MGILLKSAVALEIGRSLEIGWIGVFEVFTAVVKWLQFIGEVTDEEFEDGGDKVLDWVIIP